MDFDSTNKKILNFHHPTDFIQSIPSLITSVRLAILPHLVFAINQGFTLVSYSLFLFAMSTDLIDGKIARKLGVTSKFGSYFDSTVDFMFIILLFGVFANLGLYSNWLLAIMVLMYLQFIITNIFVKKTTFDPIGKYYGSILYADIGLTLLFPEQLTYTIVTFGIINSTLASIISRYYFLFSKKQEGNLFNYD